jgi:L,D-peptidoglycan transpeptidase YkuD (ErfK/YbiS/YcfS/YnhG family)
MPGQKSKRELPERVSQRVISGTWRGSNRRAPKAAAAACLIRIRKAPGERSRGWLIMDGRSMRVTLGRGGIRADKHEGDGGTPRGTFHPVRLWWRGDRHPRPPTRLPARGIAPDDAWCEDPASRHYNRHVRLPNGAPGDRLMRKDQLYDFIIEIDHNTRPRIAGRGSAVFFHLARADLSPTAGCVGLGRGDMLRLLARIGHHTRIVVG